MKLRFDWRAALTLTTASVLAVGLAVNAEAQGRRGGPKVAIQLMPFAHITRDAGFKPLLPKMDEFNEMEALKATITPTVLPGLKKATPSIQINYGYRKGGIGVLYEMPMQPGLKPKEAFQTLIDQGIYKERTYFKEWVIVGVPDKKLLIAVSGTSPAVKDALIRALGK